MAIDIAGLTSRSAIELQLATLTAKESLLDSTLTTLISSRSRLTEQLDALAGLREVVSIIQDKAEEMAARVGDVAETAERVGGKVRILDEEQVGRFPLLDQIMSQVKADEFAAYSQE